MRQIINCFDSKTTQIFQQAAGLKTLNAQVRRILKKDKNLPNPIPCSVSRFEQGCLTLVINDPIWSTPLRYAIPNLRDELRQSGLHHLTSIKITISPKQQSDGKSTQKSEYKLTQEARKIITSSAECCGYEPLKKALIKLTEH